LGRNFSPKVAIVSGRGQYFTADQTSNFHKTVNGTTQLGFYENPYNKVEEGCQSAGEVAVKGNGILI